jgi:hypothetical protein
LSDVLKVGLEVYVFELFDTVEHSDSSIVEVSLGTHLGVDKEVDECSLLNEFVFSIDSSVLDLLLGMLKTSVLSLFNGISPLV